MLRRDEDIMKKAWQIFALRILLLSSLTVLALGPSPANSQVPYFGNQVKQAKSPIFINGCNFGEGQNSRERYLGVLLVYFDEQAWLLGVRNDRTLTSFANSDPERIQLESWDFGGGFATAKASDELLNFLQPKPFNLRRQFSIDVGLDIMAQLSCPDAEFP